MFTPLKTETIQAFLDEARFLDTKPPLMHDMSTWKCGTSSCAVGDMALRDVCGLRMISPYGRVHFPVAGRLHSHEAVSYAFQITYRESMWLFDWRDKRGSRSFETPTQTAARIRKYLYYRMRKAEILADYETARRTEGNWGVVQYAVEMATQCDSAAS